jgi:diguanylate cyclase (GGDEF)-like protein
VHVDPDGLLSTAEKLRTLVSRSAFSEHDEQIRATVSIGASLVRDADTPDTLLQRADALMYRSKKDGRDRVTVG